MASKEEKSIKYLTKSFNHEGFVTSAEKSSCQHMMMLLCIVTLLCHNTIRVCDTQGRNHGIDIGGVQM